MNRRFAWLLLAATILPLPLLGREVPETKLDQALHAPGVLWAMTSSEVVASNEVHITAVRLLNPGRPPVQGWLVELTDLGGGLGSTIKHAVVTVDEDEISGLKAAAALMLEALQKKSHSVYLYNTTTMTVKLDLSRQPTLSIGGSGVVVDTYRRIEDILESLRSGS